MRTYRSVSVAAFAIALSALVGGFFGGRVLATQDGLPERINVFTTALKQIEQKYVEPVESDRVVYSAINGMLQTLDPHSSFMDPKAYAQLRERQEGHYYGLGITINVLDGDITVMALFEGSPAYKKGIRRGDVIAKINGEDAKGWTSEQAVLKLRGPRGTPVQVSIRRTGYDKLIDVEVVRDEIRIPSVPVGVHDEPDDRLHPAARFLRNDRPRARRRAARPDQAGHEAGAARHPREPGRPARSGHQGVEPVPQEGRPDRLHARAHREFRPGLPRRREQRLHGPAGDCAGEPPQRERVGNRDRRAAGSRSRPRRRRNDVGQGARAVDLSPQRGRGARVDDGALLHAGGPADSAAVGRELRRISLLHDARSGSGRAAHAVAAEVHDAARPQGLQRRRHRARLPHGGADRRVQPGQVRAAPASDDVRELRAALRPRGGHAVRQRDRSEGAPHARRASSRSTTRCCRTSRRS